MDILERKSDDPNTMMNQISREMEKCKHMAFGKVKTKRNVAENKIIKALMSERDKAHRENVHDDEKVVEEVKEIDDKITLIEFRAQPQTSGIELNMISNFELTI